MKEIQIFRRFLKSVTSPVKNSNTFRSFVFYDFNLIFPCQVFFDDNAKKFDKVCSFNFSVTDVVVGSCNRTESHIATL